MEARKGGSELEALAERHKVFMTEGNHLAPSHPATDNRDDGSSQRLYRHDIKVKDRPQTVMWISPDWPDGSIATA